MKIYRLHKKQNFPISVENAWSFLSNPENLKIIDLVLICTDHDNVDYDCLINNSKRVIDTRSCLPKESYNENIVKA